MKLVGDATSPKIAFIGNHGDANFAVEALDSSNQSVDLLVNTIGNYQGVVPLNVRDNSSAVALKITSNGTWAIELRNPLTARPFSNSIAGHGDDVVLYQGGSTIVHITHHGASNFAVTTVPLKGGSINLLVNEIGDYDGKVPLDAGPLLVQVTADGAWAIAPG